MDARWVLQEFKHLISVPKGLQNIRAAVLKLAISGDLTERISGDTSASELIAKNKQVKERLIALKQLKRQPHLKKILKSEEPWQLPPGWLWCRLGDVTDYGYATKAEFRDVNHKTWVLELEDIEKGTSHLLKRVRAFDRKFKSTKNNFKKGAILYGKLRPYLDKVLIADEDGVCSTEIIPITFFEGVDSRYLKTYLKSPFFIQYATNSTYGMNLPRLRTDEARNALFPLPPKEEQKRIAAKVDELMALCDKLEAQHKERLSLGRITRSTVLNSLSNAVSTSDLELSWHRLQDNMSLLIHEPEDIEEFKSAILELAITGKLNARESDVSSETLENMQNRKRNASKNKLIKRETPVIDFPGIQDLLVDIPETWIWCRLDDIASVVRGGSPRPAGDPRFYGGEIPFLKVADITKSKGMFIENFTSTIKEEGLNKTREITERTVLLTNSGATLGVPTICTFRATFNDGIAAFIELAEEVFDEYLYLYLKAKSKWLLDIASRGQGQPNLNTNIIRAMWFPLPPIAEQQAVVDTVKRILTLCDQLTEKQELAQKTGALLVSAAIKSITGIQIEDKEKMKVPKTELVSTLRIGVSPANSERAPLVAILIRNNGEIPAKTLWQASGLEIDAFYQQLKTEMARGWIVQPEVAYMREVEAS